MLKIKSEDFLPPSKKEETFYRYISLLANHIFERQLADPAITLDPILQGLGIEYRNVSSINIWMNSHIHPYTGTKTALSYLLKILGIKHEIVEWFQRDATNTNRIEAHDTRAINLPPYKFRVILTGNQDIDIERLEKVIIQMKNERTQIYDVAFPLQTQLSDASPVQGQELTCYVRGGSGNITYQWQRKGSDISSITVTNGGTGYVSAPTVTIASPDTVGTQATATANVSSGSVQSITVNNGGAGYSKTPTISFSGGSGSNASATATLPSWVNISSSTASTYIPVANLGNASLSDINKFLRCYVRKGSVVFDEKYATAELITVQTLNASLSDTTPTVGTQVTCTVTGERGITTFIWRSGGSEVHRATGTASNGSDTNSYTPVSTDSGKLLTCYVERGMNHATATALSNTST